MGKKIQKAVKSLGRKYGQDAVITQQRFKDATLKRTRKGGLPKRNIKLGKMRLVALVTTTLVSKERPTPMKQGYDDSNWREEYKAFTTNKKYLELLENGLKSFSSWILQALYGQWKKMKDMIN